MRVMLDTNVLVTGDKDFAGVDVEMPNIVTPAQYLERYASSSASHTAPTGRL